MTLEKLVRDYIDSAEKVIKDIVICGEPLKLGENSIKNVLDSAKAYLEDAKYYEQKEKLDVSLTSIAYCEGLLDALKILKAVSFEWPQRKDAERPC